MSKVKKFSNVTLRDALRLAVTEFNKHDLFYGHGTVDALGDAQYLIFSYLNLPFSDSDLYLDAKLTEKELEHLQGFIRTRCKDQVPVAYLTEKAWFCGLEFFVDERVLIPRSPIGELIDQQFSPWIGSLAPEKICDMCTGSACIAIALAYAFPDASVDAVDINKAALQVAKINIKKHKLAARVQALRSDLFENITEKYDLLVCNPPYVDAAEMAALPVEFSHEPRLALESGQDGLDCVATLLEKAPAFMTENGYLICEVGASREAFGKRFPMMPVTWIEFENGGDGVFVISRLELMNGARFD
jgi:ribosomal protein L3 glutamine methyltransferase